MFLFVGDKICLNIPNIPCILCSWTPLPFKILKSCVVIRHCMWLWAKVTIVKVLKKNPYWLQNLTFYHRLGPRPCIYMNQNPLEKFTEVLKKHSVPPFLKQGFPNSVKGSGGIKNFTGEIFLLGGGGTWGAVILTIWTFFKAKNNFL